MSNPNRYAEVSVELTVSWLFLFRYRARVTKTTMNRVKINYFGWSAEWDEWLPRSSPRLAPDQMKTMLWTKLRIGGRVRVADASSDASPAKKIKWRGGQIVEVHTVPWRGPDGRIRGKDRALRIAFDSEQRKEWRSERDGSVVDARVPMAPPQH